MNIQFHRKSKEQIKKEAMLNHVEFVGKVVELPCLKETSNGFKYATVVIEITRAYSEHDSDRVAIRLWDIIAKNAIEKCELNTLVNIRGHVQTYQVEMENKIYYNYEFIADHVSYPDT